MRLTRLGSDDLQKTPSASDLAAGRGSGRLGRFRGSGSLCGHTRVDVSGIKEIDNIGNRIGIKTTAEEVLAAPDFSPKESLIVLICPVRSNTARNQ